MDIVSFLQTIHNLKKKMNFPCTELQARAALTFTEAAPPISMFGKPRDSYKHSWTNVHLAPTRRENPMEMMSLWKRQIDPFGAAFMPFPANLLTSEQIKVGLTESVAIELYRWFCARRRLNSEINYGEIAEYVETHFL